MFNDQPNRTPRRAACTLAARGSSFLVVWKGMRNAGAFFDRRADLYGARVAEDGSVLDPQGFQLLTAAEPEQQPALVTSGDNTLLAASIFRPDLGLQSYRLATFHAPATAIAPRRLVHRGAHGRLPGRALHRPLGGRRELLELELR